MSSSEDEWILLACAAALTKKKLVKREKEKKKRQWMDNVYRERIKCTHENLIEKLELNSNDHTSNILKIDSETFDELLSMLSTKIEKKDTVMREAIPPNMRLAATLRYLAHGEKFEQFKVLTAISPKSIKTIVMETCEAIISTFADYIKVPQSEADWRDVANGFNEYFIFPQCLGVLGGRHIAIKKPLESAAMYFNKKQYYSIVLMAAVNANYEFIIADCSTNGRISDSDSIKNTAFGKCLSSHIPKPSQLPESNQVLPYVFVGNDTFQMQENILIPYSGDNLSTKQQIFNYRLKRAHRIVEKVFELMFARFRVLQTNILVSPEHAKRIVLACCYLHNFMLAKENYGFTDMLDEGTSLSEEVDESTCGKYCTSFNLECPKFQKYSSNAIEVRQVFAEYFNNHKEVSWLTDYT